MSKSALQDAIETAVADAMEGVVKESDVDKMVEEKVGQWMEKNLVESVDRAVAQMLATPKGARKTGGGQEQTRRWPQPPRALRPQVLWGSC